MTVAASIERIAFDRASVRSYDSDGHLRVETANISMSAINPYYGREIPGWQELGLAADKVYQLYRPADELEKAASSFAGKPIVMGHVALDAYDHPFERVAGAIGNDVTFEAPYLKSSLTIWPGEAIDAINTGETRALSCAYKYTPVMEGGTYEGKPFDGRMTNIVGNHLAIVREGRAGPQVVIGDSKQEAANPPQPELNMTAIVLSRKANLAHGAVLGFVRPLLLASDALPDLTSAFAGVTAANYATSKAAIAGKIAERLNGKLAADKTLEGLPAFLTAFDAMCPAEKARDEEKDEDEEKERKRKEDEDKEAKDKAAKDKAKDSEEDDEAKEKERKAAMDAAIASAVKPAVEAAVATERASAKAIAVAKDAVEAVLGKVTACDSADDYYRLGVKSLGVKGVEDMPGAALKPTFDALAESRKSAPRALSVVKAMDSAEAKTFAERFPNASRLKR